MSICDAQGGFRNPPVAPLRHELLARADGVVGSIDNRLLAKLAKLAGAPAAKSAGLEVHAKLNDQIRKNQPVLTLHAETPGELAYALAFAKANPHILKLVDGDAAAL